MGVTLLKGKSLSAKIKEDIKKELEGLKLNNRKIRLCAVQVGENPASRVYINSQRKSAEAVGMEYQLHSLQPDITEEGLIDFIKDLNSDPKVTSIILQLPLPGHINPKKVIMAISPYKDAEGMHPVNLGKILLSEHLISPCTPLAIMELLKSTGVQLYGKEAVVVGHSEIVGKPISLMLLNNFVTTTVCHIATAERGHLQDYVKAAEILIVAVGKAGLIKGEWVKEGCIVIDVGINRVEGKIVGDVEFDTAKKRAGFITPVPGGVGPLTVAMLLRNTLTAYKIQNGLLNCKEA